MEEDFTKEDAARLQRRYQAQQAGIDLNRDMCAHDYVNGIGCADCARTSRNLMLLLWAIVFVIAFISFRLLTR